MSRLMNGGYHYRGYCVYHLVRAGKLAWVLRNFEEGHDVITTKTLAEMRVKIDRLIRAEESK